VFVLPSGQEKFVLKLLDFSDTRAPESIKRLPRLIRFRDDKDPERATTLGEIKKIFNIQKK
jgi:hypothetical protein